MAFTTGMTSLRFFLVALLVMPWSFASVQAVTVRVVAYNIAVDVDGYTTARPGLDTVLEAVGEQNINGVMQPADVITLEQTTSNNTTITPLAATLNAYYGLSPYATGAFQGAEGGGNSGMGNDSSGVLPKVTVTILDTEAGE